MEKSATTTEDGTYKIVLLPPGVYTVTTGAGQGFGAATYENVKITAGTQNTLDISVSAGGSVNVVDVNAEGQGVETTRTSISSTVDERRVTNLPTNGRNFLDFVTLTTGIVRPDTRRRFGGRRSKRNFEQFAN